MTKKPTFGSGVRARKVLLRRSGGIFILGIGSGEGSSTGESTSVEMLARTRFHVRQQHDLGVKATHGDPK